VKNKNTKLPVYFSILALMIAVSVFISPKNSLSAENLYINEILIEGENGEEFVELYNPTGLPIRLENYYLAYYSSGRDWENPYRNKKFPVGSEVAPESFYLISTKTGDLPAISFDWSLDYSTHQFSDSSGSVAIFPDNIFSESNALSAIAWGTVDCVKKGKEFVVPNSGKSIEKKTPDWQESLVLGGTPGKENSPWFEKPKEPDQSAGIKIKKDEDVYKNIYANFEVEYSGATSATKYTWDFGDGHKSYKQETTHKYEESGTYAASITVRGDKKASLNFEVEVEEFDAPKVKIIRLSPNPTGKDSKKEWIEIKNDSKKKIDLKDWIIATGWDKLINHKITKKFTLKPKESKKLTSKFCAFTLNNTKNKIELRDPTGETVQKIKYNRKKGKIEEDETFSISGKNWNWNKPSENTLEKNNTDKPKENEVVNDMPTLSSEETSQKTDSEEEKKKQEENNIIKEDIIKTVVVAQSGSADITVKVRRQREIRDELPVIGDDAIGTGAISRRRGG